MRGPLANSKTQPPTLIHSDAIEHIARLARLELSADEKSRMRSQLAQILAHFADLAEIDTERIAPTAMVVNTKLPLREDEVTASLDQQQALANAPEEWQGFFAVPPVLDQ